MTRVRDGLRGHSERSKKLVRNRRVSRIFAEIRYFLSFNHDVNQFQIIASAHVTDDGSLIVSDPGVGLGLAGWGGPD